MELECRPLAIYETIDHKECTAVSTVSRLVFPVHTVFQTKAMQACDHRFSDGSPSKRAIIHFIPCSVLFRLWGPVEDARDSCLHIFASSFGKHTHPIFLPQKTPRANHDEPL